MRSDSAGEKRPEKTTKPREWFFIRGNTGAKNQREIAGMLRDQ
jgi:hypothetical protein